MFKALRHHRLAALGFLAVLLFGIGARVLNGTVYSEAAIMDLYVSLQQSSLYLGSAIATSSATILALMLTMIGLVNQVEADFDRGLYPTVALIAMASATALVLSVILLLTLSLPMGEFDAVDEGFFRFLYNAVFATVVLCCAVVVGVVLMLLSTVLMFVRRIMPEMEDETMDEEE